jgi:sugar phosphate isomerase/epimerase
MRFGTTTIPLAGWLVDPRRPALERENRLQAIRQIVTSYRLESVELTLDFSMLYPQVFNQAYYTAIRDLKQELGFTSTLHLPFLWLDLCSMNEIMREASVKAICKGYEMAEAVEAEACVLHLWGNLTQLILSMREDRSEMLALLHRQAGRSLEELSKRIPPDKICVETLEKPSFELFAGLVDLQGLRICLDIGHLYWQQEGYVNFLKRYGSLIGEVHLHDARRKRTEAGSKVLDHLPLGEGDIDPAAFLKSLEELGYQGPVILENNTREDFEKSLAWLKEWRGSDDSGLSPESHLMS